MGIFGKNKYNVNFISLPQQVSKNKIDIENLQKIIKQAYKTTTILNEQSVSVELNTTNITDVTIKNGWLMDPNGLLFQIASVLEDLVYINFWANIKGETGATGAQGPQGKRGFGFYTTQQQILSTGITEIEYGDIIGYDNPQVGDFVISENEQSTGYYGRITSLATLTTTIEYIGTLKSEKGMNFVGKWVGGGEYYVDDVVTWNGDAFICIKNVNGSYLAPNSDDENWLLVLSGAKKMYRHSITFEFNTVAFASTIIFSTQSLPYTITTLKQFLANNAYNSYSSVYPATGSFPPATTSPYISIVYGIFQNNSDGNAIRVGERRTTLAIEGSKITATPIIDYRTISTDANIIDSVSEF